MILSTKSFGISTADFSEPVYFYIFFRNCCKSYYSYSPLSISLHNGTIVALTSAQFHIKETQLKGGCANDE